MQFQEEGGRGRRWFCVSGGGEVILVVVVVVALPIMLVGFRTYINR